MGAKIPLIDPDGAFLIPGIEDPNSEIKAALNAIFGRQDIMQARTVSLTVFRPKIGTVAPNFPMPARVSVPAGVRVEAPLRYNGVPEVEIGHYFFNPDGSARQGNPQLASLAGCVIQTLTKTKAMIPPFFRPPSAGFRDKNKSKSRRCWIWGRRKKTA